MSLIKWKEDFSVGISEIDSQHKEIINMINLLNDSMKRGEGQQVIGKILKEMSDYVNIHFQTEEKYFEKYNYPEKSSHISRHREFIEEVSQFREQFQQSKAMLTLKVITFLKKWLTEHITGEDSKYKSFFLSKGLK